MERIFKFALVLNIIHFAAGSSKVAAISPNHYTSFTFLIIPHDFFDPPIC